TDVARPDLRRHRPAAPERAARRRPQRVRRDEGDDRRLRPAGAGARRDRRNEGSDRRRREPLSADGALRAAPGSLRRAREGDRRPRRPEAARPNPQGARRHQDAARQRPERHGRGAQAAAGGAPMSTTEDIDALTRASSFIFSGTVQSAGASNVAAVEPGDSLLLVRVERGLRSDPALGDIRGRLVTVKALSPDELPVGAQAVFFTNSWVHGDEIAVLERAHLGAERADEVADAVGRLPDMHLADRLRAAAAVVRAVVA